MRFAETEVFLRESIENGIFTRFIFTDDNKSENLIKLLGAEALVGTAPSSNPENASTKAWAADYIAEYGAGASPAQRPSAIGPESLWAVTKAEARRHVRAQQWSAGGYEFNGYRGQVDDGALMVFSSEGEPLNQKHREPHA